MRHMQEYYKVLEKTNEIALATAVDNIPNVRIVNFVYDTNKPGILYFASDRENQKVAEFNQNNQVSFTTVPTEGIPHIRSNQAIVQRSMFSIDDIKEQFITRIPGYDETIKAIGDTLDVFEIRVQEAVVISGFDEPVSISFKAINEKTNYMVR